ncbi:hypothetical protein RRG08_015311 [Elysia crispata]|uniref:Uncharacterized protein n=1 Tax=Elysia crispata TaxID=231223 RepID=A0AAE0ZU50_9GAST|nr:hypothetical protein RRG08_015311 [Elysia crispata]
MISGVLFPDLRFVFSRGRGKKANQRSQRLLYNTRQAQHVQDSKGKTESRKTKQNAERIIELVNNLIGLKTFQYLTSATYFRASLPSAPIGKNYEAVGPTPSGRTNKQTAWIPEVRQDLAVDSIPHRQIYT